MDKKVVLERILAELRKELAVYFRAASSARQDATDEESRAENKYDTRGLEASYLARGQARKVQEIQASIENYGNMVLVPAGPDATVETGILVELEQQGEPQLYFMGPSSGGMEVEVDGREVMVITGGSPLGASLAGHRAGDAVEMKSAGGAQTFRILNLF